MWQRLLASVASLSGAAVDAAVLAVMKGPWALPSSSDLERLASEVREAHSYYGSLGYLHRPSKFHGEPRELCEVRIEDGGRWPIPHDVLTYPSGYEPHAGDPAAERWEAYEENRTAHAWMVEGHPEAPWLVCLHGAGTGRPMLDAAAFAASRLHEQLGLNLLFPIQPLHGARRSSRTGYGAFLTFELLDTLHGFTQSTWEARRLIRWLRARGAKRVGVYGISLGAYTAALLSTLEPVELVVAGIPLCDVPELYVAHSRGPVHEQAKELGLLGPELGELFQLVSPLVMPQTAPREARLVYAATSDGIVPPSQAHRLWEHWERPEISWYPGGHVSFLWALGVQRFVEEGLRRSGFCAAPQGRGRAALKPGAVGSISRG